MNRWKNHVYASFLFFITALFLNSITISAGAPSVWLYPSAGTGDILMQDVRVPYATSTTYYCILQWNAGQEGGGYCGVQATKHVHFAIWDPSNSQKIQKIYATQNCSYQTFGGEGTGMKSQWTYTWPDNVWLTHVVRTWNCSNHTYFGFWFKDNSTNVWIHVLTYDYPVANVVFRGTGTFLEDYGGNTSSKREMHITNGWKRVNGNWVAFQKQSLSANGGSAWNGGKKENYFFMESGGNSSGGTSSSNTITLADKPDVPAIAATSFAVTYSNPTVSTTWEIDVSKAPQFGYTISIYDNKDCTGNPLYSDNKSGEPEIRTSTLNAPNLDVATKQYFAKLALTDVLDQKAEFIKEFGTAPIINNNHLLFKNLTVKNGNNGDLILSASEETIISLKIFDYYGRKIYSLKNLTLHNGQQTITWRNRNNSGNPGAGGIYFLKLKAGNITQTNRIIIR